MESEKNVSLPENEYFTIEYIKNRIADFVPKFHSHDHYVIYLFMRGDASYVFDNFEHHLVPGDIVIVPPGVMHCAWLEAPSSPCERLIARVSPAAIKNMQIPGFSAARRINEIAEKQEFCHSVPIKAFDKWKDELLKYAHIDLPEPETKLAMLGTLTILIAYVLSQQPKLPKETDSVVAKIAAYIDDRFREDLTLERISSEFFMSQSRLSHVFRDYSGMSVHRYITVKRIEKAKQLLEEGNVPADVCNLCGYSDYSCFYRAFTKETGISPRDYAAEKE